MDDLKKGLNLWTLRLIQSNVPIKVFVASCIAVFAV